MFRQPQSLHILSLLNLLSATSRAFQVQCPSPAPVGQSTECKWIRTSGDGSSFGLLLREITQDHGGTLVSTIRNTGQGSGTFEVTYPDTGQYLLEVVRNLDGVSSNEVPQVLASSQTITAVSNQNSGNDQDSKKSNGSTSKSASVTPGRSQSTTVSGDASDGNSGNEQINDGSNADGSVAIAPATRKQRATTHSRVPAASSTQGITASSSLSVTTSSAQSLTSSASISQSTTTVNSSDASVSSPLSLDASHSFSLPSSTPSISSAASSPSNSNLPLVFGLSFGLLFLLIAILLFLLGIARSRRRRATSVFYQEKMENNTDLSFSDEKLESGGNIDDVQVPSQRSRITISVGEVSRPDSPSSYSYRTSRTGSVDPRIAALWQNARSRISGLTTSTEISMILSASGTESGVTRVVDVSSNADTNSSSNRQSTLSFGAPSSMSEPEVLYTTAPAAQAARLGEALGVGWDKPAPRKQVMIKETLAPWFRFPPRPPPHASLPQTVNTASWNSNLWVAAHSNNTTVSSVTGTDSVVFPTVQRSHLSVPQDATLGADDESYRSLASVPIVSLNSHDASNPRLATSQYQAEASSTWTLAGTRSSSGSAPPVPDLFSYSSHASHGRTDEY
ncbi:hypothetical protein VKT23_019851 [Stygiomarasmius scandens]|uniref:Uncharacterized protein n=1 Tax=Marasmiellus scandens TaxID=2682957 RepID=A0ABR1IPL1_9AGAR